MTMLGRDDQHLVGAPTKKQDMYRHMPVTISGISCISVIWITATFVILSGLIVAGGFPTWIRNRVQIGAPARSLGNTLTRVDLGLYYLCYKLRGCGDPNSAICEDECRRARACGCYPYMNYNPPPMINSTTDNLMIESGMVPFESPRDIVFLFSASIVYAFGCLLLLVSLFVGTFAFYKPKLNRRCNMFMFAFVLQAVAGKVCYSVIF